MSIATQATGKRDPGSAIGLGSSLLLAAFRQGATTNFASGADLIRVGESPRQVHRVKSGLAYASWKFADGRRAITDLLLPGNIVGLKSMRASQMSWSVVAAGPVRCWSMAAESLRQMRAESQPVDSYLDTVLLEAFGRVERLTASVARLDAHERVAGMLIDIYERQLPRPLPDRHRFSLPLTQQQIGDHLGLSGVHVNRVLQRFARERIACVKSRSVTIGDLRRLRLLASGASRATPHAAEVSRGSFAATPR